MDNGDLLPEPLERVVMTEEAIYSGLQRVFDAVFHRHDIKLTVDLTAADVPGWDSFMYINFIIGIEELFKIRLDGPELDELQTIGDLARAVARLTNERDPRHRDHAVSAP